MINQLFKLSALSLLALTFAVSGQTFATGNTAVCGHHTFKCCYNTENPSYGAEWMNLGDYKRYHECTAAMDGFQLRNTCSTVTSLTFSSSGEALYQFCDQVEKVPEFDIKIFNAKGKNG